MKLYETASVAIICEIIRSAIINEIKHREVGNQTKDSPTLTKMKSKFVAGQDNQDNSVMNNKDNKAPIIIKK